MNANALELVNRIAAYAATTESIANADFSAALGDSFKMAAIIGKLQGALRCIAIDADVCAKVYGGSR